MDGRVVCVHMVCNFFRPKPNHGLDDQRDRSVTPLFSLRDNIIAYLQLIKSYDRADVRTMTCYKLLEPIKTS